jgi:hypothetical protein
MLDDIKSRPFFDRPDFDPAVLPYGCEGSPPHALVGGEAVSTGGGGEGGGGGGDDSSSASSAASAAAAAAAAAGGEQFERFVVRI